MAAGGSLVAGTLGALLGQGPGRGIGLMLLLSSLSMVLAVLAMYGYPRLRLIEDDLGDIEEESEE
jgi:hypothetical protein